MAEWTDRPLVTPPPVNREAEALQVKLQAATRAVTDLAAYLSHHHTPTTVLTLLGPADACSCCTDDQGQPVLYPCRTMRLVREYQRHVLQLTDGRKVGRHG